jgi:excinuclease ABC subunit C
VVNLFTGAVAASHQASSTHHVEAQITKLKEHARHIRMNSLRMGEVQGQGYVGQALGFADVLAVLYMHALRLKPAEPKWEGRDRCLLSIGHYAIGLYAALIEAGVIPIEEIESYQTKSVVYTKHQYPMDVFSIAHKEDQAYVSYLMIQEGRIIQTHILPLTVPLEENKETILSFAIHYFRTNLSSDAKEIILPIELEDTLPGVKYTIPLQGDKEQLLALSQKNADYALKDWEYKQKLVQVNPIKDDSVLQELTNQLHLGAMPVHIECFDNSNIQGAFPVSAMVCFKNGQPSKSDYRKFNIKTVVGINDFASMKESVYRRYKSVLAKQQALPQLIIIDGGKGQLNAAIEALTELGIQQQVTTVGLAKNLEEIFFVGDKDSLKLNWQSDAHRLIRNIRDEVHRFGIQFHRSKRSKGALENSLDQIEGIGPKTKDLLLIYFKSVQKIKEAKLELLSEIIGPSKAQILKAAFEKRLDE